jgi:DNA-binding response OmpR family regulator
LTDDAERERLPLVALPRARRGKKTEGQALGSDDRIRGLRLTGEGKMRVLIVEDDASIGELCRLVLEDEGYNCALARNLAGARESLAGRGIDLLLADVVLPDGGTGRDLAEEMAVAGVPVIYMSGDYRALRELTESGIAHLQKPFRVPELVSRVRDAIALGRPPRADA